MGFIADDDLPLPAGLQEAVPVDMHALQLDLSAAVIFINQRLIPDEDPRVQFQVRVMQRGGG